MMTSRYALSAEWLASQDVAPAKTKNPVAVRFGDNLRACRLRAEISQEELGFRASLHRTEIGLLERGQREPKLETIVKLASALDVPLGELVTGIDWKP